MELLLPWRTHLQSCGLIAAPEQVPALSRLLLDAGVGRLCPVGTMHDGYAGEPHDGVYALSRLTRRVSVSLRDGQLPGHATLDALPPPPAGLDALPVMDKMAFQQAEMGPAAQLFFRSGGGARTSWPASATAITTARCWRRRTACSPPAWTRRMTG